MNSVFIGAQSIFVLAVYRIHVDCINVLNYIPYSFNGGFSTRQQDYSLYLI